MEEILIIGPDLEVLKNDERFAIALQLSRFVNVLRANQRHYLRIVEEHDPASMRDKIELILHHGAIVFEAEKTMLDYGGELERTPTWSSKAAAVNLIKAEFGDQMSFTHRYLKFCRNKLAFHYDDAVLKRTLRDFPLKDHPVFAQALSEREMDLAFVLVDEILLESLLSRMNERSTEKEKWAYFQDELLRISDNLAGLLGDFILDLAGRNLALVENP